MTAKLVALLAVLLAVVGHQYRPARWPHQPKELAVTNPPMIDEDIIAVHAIRWRSHRFDDLPTASWEMVLEVANVSRFEIVRVKIELGPTNNFDGTDEHRLIIKRGNPVWIIFSPYLPEPKPYVKPPPPSKPGASPPRPPRPTTVAPKPKRPRFGDIDIEVISVQDSTP